MINVITRKGGNCDALQLEASRRGISRFVLFLAEFISTAHAHKLLFPSVPSNADTAVVPGDYDFLYGAYTSGNRPFMKINFW